MSLTLVAVVATALFFDYTNGFHDAANAIATSVSTQALTPRVAVGLAAVLNFAGAFISLKVATTVGSGIVDTNAVTLEVVLAGVVGAIAWNLTTWVVGLPTSSSHALIGGVMGSAIAAAGWNVVNWHGLTHKVLFPSIASPFLGFALAAALVVAIMMLFRNRSYGRTTRGFRRSQVVSAGFVALTHGTNDAQKTMGVIALALVAAHPSSSFHVPFWVIFTCALAMGAGTYSGGWRIIRTLGQRVTHLDPHQGFAAETATAVLLWTTAHYGYPVSTTHTISGSVLGGGAAKRLSAVRWGIAGNIVMAWLITIPAAGAVAALMELVTQLPGGQAIVLALAALMATLAFAAAAGRFPRPQIRRRAPAVIAPPGPAMPSAELEGGNVSSCGPEQADRDELAARS